MNIFKELETRARRQPDRPAVSHGDRTASFAAFTDRARRIGGALRHRLGLGQGDRVVICMENRPELLELLFASWAAGLCAVPVNAKLHAREVEHIAGDCDARAIFLSEAVADGFAWGKGGGVSPHLVDGADYERLAKGDPIGPVEVDGRELAWIFYTSGTTGSPKGAMLSHRNLLFMSLCYHADIGRVEPGCTMLHAAPLSHGSGLYALPHLFGGGHQIVLPGFDPGEILDSLDRFPRVSFFAAPTMVNRLVAAAVRKEGAAGNLETILYGGAPMYLQDMIRAMELFGPRFFQIFGQGEAPMTITGLDRRDHEGDFGSAHLARLGSCGVARSGVEVAVIDDDGRPVPAGERGEVVTRSPCVMTGYWNNPEATAAALRAGWLRTGDIGSLDEAGYLTLCDRSKDMIISGGTNIYPREIEEVLLRHPAVQECAVVGRRHHDWGEEPVAFIVTRYGAQATAEALDDLCIAHIARFKRPKHYRFVDAMPKNSTGKVLKAELRRALENETHHA